MDWNFNLRKGGKIRTRLIWHTIDISFFPFKIHVAGRRLFRYVALCLGGDFSATRANYTSDVEFALGLPWCCAAMIRGVMSHGDVQRSRLQRENTLNKRRWATAQKSSKKAQEGYPETAPRKPKDGPRGSQEATNKAQDGPLFDEFAPGLPWCRGARSPSSGQRGPQEAAKKAQ